MRITVAPQNRPLGVRKTMRAMIAGGGRIPRELAKLRRFRELPTPGYSDIVPPRAGCPCDNARPQPILNVEILPEESAGRPLYRCTTR